jgi:hypothetical protein
MGFSASLAVCIEADSQTIEEGLIHPFVNDDNTTDTMTTIRIALIKPVSSVISVTSRHNRFMMKQGHNNQQSQLSSINFQPTLVNVPLWSKPQIWVTWSAQADATVCGATDLLGRVL